MVAGVLGMDGQSAPRLVAKGSSTGIDNVPIQHLLVVAAWTVKDPHKIPDIATLQYAILQVIVFT